MQTREEWLKQRRDMITASDVAAILGANPYRSPLQVYADKVLGEKERDNDAMAMGRRMEGPIAEAYAEKTGRFVMDIGATEIQIHPDIHWLGATLDRWDNDNGPLEIKFITSPLVAQIWKDGETPIYNQIQLQIQTACTGAPRGTLCGCIYGREIKWVDYDRNDNFLDAAYPALEEFWKRVQSKDPPPPSTPMCLDAVKRLHPEDNGEIVVLNQEHLDAVIEMEALKFEKKAMENRIKELEMGLRVAVGDATFGSLLDGHFVSLKTTHTKGYVREIKPSTYRTLRVVKKI